MSIKFIPVTGKCDACSKPAVYWYGSTSVRYCGSEDCETRLSERYQEHCDEIDRQHQLKKEMEDEYGN